MPNGRFDQTRAAAAVTALQDTVALLQRQGPAREALAIHALEEWSGPHADSFRTQRYPDIKAQMAATIRILNSLITTIQDAAKAAAKGA